MKNVIMKNIDKIVIGVAIAIGGVLIYRSVRTKKSLSGKSETTDYMKNSYVSEFPLRNGSRGESVKKLQTYLNRKNKPPFAPLVVDGIFGNLTEDALKRVTGKKVMSETEFKTI